MELEIVIQQSTHDKNALLAAPGEARVAVLRDPSGDRIKWKDLHLIFVVSVTAGVFISAQAGAPRGASLQTPTNLA